MPRQPHSRHEDSKPAPPGSGLRVLAADTIPPSTLDRDARRVILRLQHHGHEAYFVGGCVRDLWIGRQPKDFDVATSAHPHEIRRLFRNGRIIGRRFRLVHIYYGDHVVETSTFRRDPENESEEELGENGLVERAQEDLLIVEDNVFGTAAEDARRRDFTVNALFLDPARHCILDYVHGLADLEARVLRTIGDPRVRMAEDPVRILRAVKFATRLDFRIEDETWGAMKQHAQQLRRAALPRVLEEILRLLRSGVAQGAFKMLRACGALAVLLPPLDEYLGPHEDPGPEAMHRAERFWRLLEALDSQVNHSHYLPTNAVALAVLFLHVIERAAEAGAPESALVEELGPLCDEVFERVPFTARMARRDLARARRIICQQARFVHPPARRFSPLLFALGEEFPESLELFGLRVDARGQGKDIYEGWVERYRRAREASADELESERRRIRKRRRPRHRRGREGPPD